MSVEVSVPWGSVYQPIDPITYVYRTFYSGGVPYTTYSTTSYHERETKVRTGLCTAPFINGWRYATDYTVDIHKWTWSELTECWSSINNQYTSAPQFAASNWDARLVFTDTALVSAYNNLVTGSNTRALDKLNGTQVAVGENLAEGRKTLEHLGETCIRLLKLFRAVRRGNLSEAAEVLGLNVLRSSRGLAKDWLEYTYAWRPLVLDVHAAYELAQKGLQKPLTIKAVSKFSSSVHPYLKEYVKTNYDATHWYAPLVETRVEALGSVKTTIHAKVKNAHIQNMKAFGLLNPAEVAWEVVPFSFVVDWFVPIGTFLNACTATLFLDFVDGSQVKCLSYDETRTCPPNSGAMLKSKPYKNGDVRYQKFLMNRSKLTDFPAAGLYGNSFLATPKIVTAAALFRAQHR